VPPDEYEICGLEIAVPIAFEGLKQVKDERGGFIAFVFPQRAEWYSETSM
jgi:hypothetical protein